jgi:transcriptional regulator GlxA family with amidase domain
MRTRKAPSIVLLAAENTSPSVLYGLFDVLYSVGAVFLDMTVGHPGSESLEVRIASLDGRAFRCLGGIAVEPHAAITEIQSADAVVVCDMYSPIDKVPTGQYTEFANWLQAMHRQGVLIASVCSGTLVLAEAGLLNGREAAAHWAYGALFERHYPSIRMRKDSVLCLSAVQDGLVTAGGVTAWQDLALYLIARFCGRTQAYETAKIHLLSGHEDGQLPFVAMNRQLAAEDKVIAECQTWIANNFVMPNPVGSMAERAGLNVRTLSRRFQAATGRSPLDYALEIRVEAAKRMLEEGSDTIDEIGLAIGYNDPASFRRLFRRQSGMTPAAYRKKFANIRAFEKQKSI